MGGRRIILHKRNLLRSGPADQRIMIPTRTARDPFVRHIVTVRRLHRWGGGFSASIAG